MALDSAITNVDEWIGEYYLTTDEKKESFRGQVEALVKGWKDTPVGAVNPLGRLTSVRQGLLTALSQQSATERDERTDDVARTRTREALGYGRPGDFSWTRGETEWSAQVWAGAEAMLFVEADPVDTIEDLRDARPLGQVVADGKDTSASLGTLIGELFLGDTPPAFIAATAGRWFLLAERESWPLGRFLAIDLLFALERNETKVGGEVQRVAAAAARESVERRPDGTTWWAQVLEDSRQHAVRVSGALREAIRESLEIIANDVLSRSAAQGLDVSHFDGQVLARESLRYLYRILFLLFAEASPELHIVPVGPRSTTRATAYPACAITSSTRPRPRPRSRARICTSRWNCCSAASTKATIPQTPRVSRRGWSSTNFRRICSLPLEPAISTRPAYQIARCTQCLRTC